MVKRTLLGILVLILVAIGVIIAAFIQFDIPREELKAKYANDASQFIEISSGAVIHVRDQGNPDGAPLVLVHGSNASLHTWEPWVDELGDTYRVISLDMPAHGLTGATPEGDYSVGRMAAVTREVAERLGLETFTLGGNSMGGAVALNYAVAYPEDLDGLILVCAGGIAREEDEASSGDAARSFSLVNMPVVSTLLRWVTPRFVFEDALNAVFVDQSLVTDEMVQRYYDLNVMEGTRDATRERFSLERKTVPDATVREIDIPTLVMWGDKDPLIPVSVGRRFHALLPNSTLVIYENVGHIPHEEVAARSAGDVRAFMEGNPSAGGLPELEGSVTIGDDGSLTNGDVVESGERVEAQTPEDLDPEPGEGALEDAEATGEMVLDRAEGAIDAAADAIAEDVTDAPETEPAAQ